MSFVTTNDGTEIYYKDLHTMSGQTTDAGRARLGKCGPKTNVVIGFSG
jgi:hypothetical protein